jgi:hypothetical protein
VIEHGMIVLLMFSIRPGEKQARRRISRTCLSGICESIMTFGFRGVYSENEARFGADTLVALSCL